MKLVVAIVQDRDAGRVIDELVTHGFGATRINTAGAFWKRNNATILTGVPDGDVDRVVDIFQQFCRAPEGHPTAGILFVLPVAASLKF